MWVVWALAIIPYLLHAHSIHVLLVGSMDFSQESSVLSKYYCLSFKFSFPSGSYQPASALSLLAHSASSLVYRALGVSYVFFAISSLLFLKINLCSRILVDPHSTSGNVPSRFPCHLPRLIISVRKFC